MRVALACALFAAPDILCLDEPTTHLELQATLWLQVGNHRALDHVIHVASLAFYQRSVLLIVAL